MTGRNIIILSEKCSGSTILQTELCKHPDISHVAVTEHFEYETLYWLKAACILRDDRSEFLDGRKKYPPHQAYSKLLALVRGNVPDFEAPDDPASLVDAGWRALSERYGPVFLEKSPHRAQNWAALQVMHEALLRQRIPFLVVFLYRNPRAILASAWERWGSPPNTHQNALVTAYRNMDRFKTQLEPQTYLELHYEDFVENPKAELARICHGVGVCPEPSMGDDVHARSKSRDKQTVLRRPVWGFLPIKRTVSFAEHFRPTAAFVDVCQQFGYGQQLQDS